MQIGQDRTGQDRTGQDRMGQERIDQDRTAQDRTAQGRTGQGRAGQDRTGEERGCDRGQSTEDCGDQEHQTGEQHPALNIQFVPQPALLTMSFLSLKDIIVPFGGTRFLALGTVVLRMCYIVTLLPD